MQKRTSSSIFVKTQTNHFSCVIKKKKKIERAKRASINQERSENNGPPSGTDALQSGRHVLRRCREINSARRHQKMTTLIMTERLRLLEEVLPLNQRWLETKTHPSHTIRSRHVLSGRSSRARSLPRPSFSVI